MEIPYEKAKAEYFGISDDPIREMLKDSKEFKELLCPNLALGRFLPKDWVGIKRFPTLDLAVREDFSASHKMRARPINPRLFCYTEKGVQETCDFLVLVVCFIVGFWVRHRSKIN